MQAKRVILSLNPFLHVFSMQLQNSRYIKILEMEEEFSQEQQIEITILFNDIVDRIDWRTIEE